jgi:hypothetical protein
MHNPRRLLAIVSAMVALNVSALCVRAAIIVPGPTGRTGR